MSIVILLCRIATANDLWYKRSNALNASSVNLEKPFKASFEWVFKSLEHSMGVVVSEMSKDTPIATESVTANSLKSLPTIPPMSKMGIKTAMSEILIDWWGNYFQIMNEILINFLLNKFEKTPILFWDVDDSADFTKTNIYLYFWELFIGNRLLK